MTEESIIDVILEIRENQRKLDKRIDLIESNLALLNNKANGELISAVRKHIPLGIVDLTKPNKKDTSQVGPEKPFDTAPKIKKGSTELRSNTNVFGTIVNSKGDRLTDVTVKIMNEKGEVLKSTATNSGGVWRAFLPPGKYSAEYIKIGLPPQFRVIEVIDGMKELQVT